MPSLWSATEPVSTACGSAIFAASASVIIFALLPFPTLKTKPRDENGREQERDHRCRDRGAFAEIAGQDRTLIRQRCHKVRGVDWPAAREHPDKLKVGEREQDRKRHDHCDDRRQ